MRIVLSAALLTLFISPPLLAAGHAYNENFSVLTPREAIDEHAKRFAENVLARAEYYRKTIAQQWLGEELPPGKGRTLINVSFADADAGFTWAVDRSGRRYHRVFLTTTPQRALGNTLAHEICHVVLATHFPHPNRLPAWMEEGIASRYDDEARRAKRRRIVNTYVRSGNWPSVERILSADRIAPDDQSSYAAAVSVTDFLISRKGRATLLEFGAQVAQGDLAGAIERHYQFRTVHELSAAWQAWVRQHGQLAIR